ncbi:MAG: hypothetical protein A2V84_08715 [Chloroflexi bacterium RBG_16_70_13]|nr:MAG: hypothetical protein A2V84_08715 [Chloroflexi bacterium RBG_16_70_13]
MDSRLSLPATEFVGSVSTEGGPIIVGDADLLVTWHGALGPGDDYGRLVERIPDDPRPNGIAVELGGASAFAWTIPTGSVEVWRQAGRVTLQFAWYPSSTPTLTQRLGLLNRPGTQSQWLGRVEIRTGWMGIIWAAEDVAEMRPWAHVDGEISSGATSDSGVILKLNAGVYSASQDEVVEKEGASAYRCSLIREGQAG